VHFVAVSYCSELVISDEAFARPTSVIQRVASAGGVYLFRILLLFLGGHGCTCRLIVVCFVLDSMDDVKYWLEREPP
jgi:hypothetical protein